MPKPPDIVILAKHGYTVSNKMNFIDINNYKGIFQCVEGWCNFCIKYLTLNSPKNLKFENSCFLLIKLNSGINIAAVYYPPNSHLNSELHETNIVEEKKRSHNRRHQH